MKDIILMVILVLVSGSGGFLLGAWAAMAKREDELRGELCETDGVVVPLTKESTLGNLPDVTEHLAEFVANEGDFGSGKLGLEGNLHPKDKVSVTVELGVPGLNNSQEEIKPGGSE